ncbi:MULTISPECIES: PepSY-associated TM helix domain-containing protein [unclassified Sphingobium]|uniref:PepSY-associated TM helix domain-containing protein n=1 Tax=unclassified Sphingobium TaxID=2611147 RepID=UPI0022253D9A|nr:MULTISPECIES: PepSY-associated TM helix domain-containing protein [unclassified Sphingobium]MCW2413345.1 putative iron-regulated membrane protein [Sphingobium sp. B8D3D]MCW2414356.1 putative iron-regulated membrane protein [Sphingobium sp. B8D3A]
MRETFRLSMAYLHTWLGLVVGFVLMAVFFFGSLSVFDREIDRWSVPETRAQAAPFPSFDRSVLPVIASVKPDAESIEHTAAEVIGALPPADAMKVGDVGVYTNHRDPILRMYVAFDVPNKPRDANLDHVHVYGFAAVDPQTGERLPADVQDRLNLGTGFFFPMHYMLHLDWMEIGYWIVGLAGMVMMALLVSGVVMHRKIFRELFTFRPEKARLRSMLDLHNMTGVLALPFLFVITLSGLLIFAYMYLPSPTSLMRPLAKAQELVEASGTGLPVDPSGRPGELASVDAMMDAAKARWTAKGVPGEVGSVVIVHYGDADAYVSIARDNVDRVATSETLHFKGSTGALLYEDPPASGIRTTEGFLYGLHFQQFRHWPLRWLLFAGGLAGCACIATGFLFFVEKRKKKHAATGAPGARIAEAFAVASVTGMLIATGTMMVANRLLPTSLPGHGAWQEGIFWLTWLATLGHAALRSRASAHIGVSPAWAEQCWLVALLAVGAAIANWATTGDHLIATIANGYWPVAGVDLVLLATAGVAAYTAVRLSARAERLARMPSAIGKPAHV